VTDLTDGGRDALAPTAHTDLARARLRQSFAEHGHARLAPALPEAFAVECLRALRAADFIADQRVDPDLGYQIWRFDWDPSHADLPDASGDTPTHTTACVDHPLCALGRAFQRELHPWVEAVTDLALARADAPFEAQRLGKGGFVDPVAAAVGPGQRPRVAAVLHLATAPWPESWGGHYEVATRTMPLDEGTVLDRPRVLAPDWNTLDLVDLARYPWHRVPLLTRHVDAFRVMIRFGDPTPSDLRR